MICQILFRLPLGVSKKVIVNYFFGPGLFPFKPTFLLFFPILNPSLIFWTKSQSFLEHSKPKIKVVRGKLGKKTGYKKAIITLKEGQTIDMTSGV